MRIVKDETLRSSNINRDFRLTPGGKYPQVKRAQQIDNGMKYKYDNGIEEKVYSNGDRVFFNPKYGSGQVRFERNGTKQLIDRDKDSVKFFYKNNTCETKINNEKVSGNKSQNLNIKRDLFPDGTQVKRYLKEKFEIRKKGPIKQAGLAREDGSLITFLEKDLNTGKITLHIPPDYYEPLQYILQDQNSARKSFSELAKEIVSAFKYVKKTQLDDNIKRDLFPDGTKVKRYLKQKFEIRKKRPIKQAGLAREDGSLITFLEKNLNTGKITSRLPDLEPFQHILQDSAKKFSEVAKEIVKLVGPKA